MNIKFRNAKILTMENGFEVIEGELWVKGSRIVFAGTKEQLQKVYQEKDLGCIIWDREVDVKQNLLMPGFKNAHTHSGMSALRSYADDMKLLDWLNEQVFPLEAKMNGDDIYHLTKLAVMEYLTSGVTAIFDMYLTPETIAKATEECGMRCVQVGAVNNFSQSVAMMEEMYLKLNNGNELTSYVLGMHGEYTCSEDLLKEISALVHKYKTPFFTHNSESEREVQECLERTGTSPTVYMDSFGLFDFGGGCYHCVHMTDEDISIFKKHNLSVVTNPGSNTKLSSGIAPIYRFLQEDINVAIGTDGPASNNCLDMFREMFLVTGLAKLREKDASVIDANQVLYMATVGGAKAMGLSDSDVLTEGKYADLIMIDLAQPNMQPINNISKNIVYSGSKQNIKMTMIHGKILYEDGQFAIGSAPNDIYAKANEIIERIK